MKILSTLILILFTLGLHAQGSSLSINGIAGLNSYSNSNKYFQLNSIPKQAIGFEILAKNEITNKLSIVYGFGYVDNGYAYTYGAREDSVGRQFTQMYSTTAHTLTIPIGVSFQFKQWLFEPSLDSKFILGGNVYQSHTSLYAKIYDESICKLCPSMRISKVVLENDENSFALGVKYSYDLDRSYKVNQIGLFARYVWHLAKT